LASYLLRGKDKVDRKERKEERKKEEKQGMRKSVGLKCTA
jgi:hypothetical protein